MEGFRSIGLVLGTAALSAALSAGVAGADVRTIRRHAQLGFAVSGAMPDDISQADGFACLEVCIPFVGCAEICDGVYFVDVSDISVSVGTALGADFDLSYDRANILPGADLPIDIAYTPTNDPGSEFDLSFDGSITAGMTIFIPFATCLVPPQDIELKGMAGDLHAPLSNDGAMVIPVQSDLFLAACFPIGPIGLRVQGDITLTPVPSFDSTTLVPPIDPLPLIGGTFLPAVGGGTATFTLRNAAAGTLLTGGDLGAIANNQFPIEWQSSGETKTRKVLLNDPLTPMPFTPGPVLETQLGTILHWVNINADLDLRIVLPIIGDVAGVGILDADTIKDAIDNRKCQDGPMEGAPCTMDADCGAGFTCGGDLGQKVGDVVEAMVFGQLDGLAMQFPIPELITARDTLPPAYGEAFRARVNALNFPIPFFEPPLATIEDPEHLPAFGTLRFDIPTDSDGDGLSDGEEIGGDTDPDDPDSDDDGFNDGEEAALDAVGHFQCYEVRPPAAFARTGVHLVDRFGESMVDLRKVHTLCAPAAKNDEDPTASADPAHLTLYGVGGTARFAGAPGEIVRNQFGTLTVDLTRRARLAVPTAKGLGAPPAPLTTELDHFACYKVRRAPSGPRFVRIGGVQVATQFETTSIDLVKPLRLCVPADKNAESPSAASHPVSLLCYRTRASGGLPPTAVSLDNQFGPQDYLIRQRREFCVPSLLGPTTTTSSTSTTSSSSTSTSTSSSTTTSTSSTSTTTPPTCDPATCAPAGTCFAGTCQACSCTSVGDSQMACVFGCTETLCASSADCGPTQVCSAEGFCCPLCRFDCDPLNPECPVP